MTKHIWEDAVVKELMDTIFPNSKKYLCVKIDKIYHLPRKINKLARSQVSLEKIFKESKK